MGDEFGYYGTDDHTDAANADQFNRLQPRFGSSHRPRWNSVSWIEQAWISVCHRNSPRCMSNVDLYDKSGGVSSLTVSESTLGPCQTLDPFVIDVDHPGRQVPVHRVRTVFGGDTNGVMWQSSISLRDGIAIPLCSIEATSAGTKVSAITRTAKKRSTQLRKIVPDHHRTTSNAPLQ